MKINRFAAVLMMLCLMAGSALAAQFTVEKKVENGVITAVNADSMIEALVFPDKVKDNFGEELRVAEITADLSGFTNLSYIRFETPKLDLLPAADLSTVPDLECVYFTPGVPEKDEADVRKRIGVGDTVELLQWMDLSDKEIKNITTGYAGGNVTIQFPNVIPDGYGGYGYRVTREPIGNSGSEEVFDSERNVSRFGISNGTVTFTDFIDQTASQQSYRYTIMAYEPFGSLVTSRPPVDVTIPAKPVPAEPASVPAPAAPDAVPATGDEAAPLLWTALIAMSAIGMAMALRKRK